MNLFTMYLGAPLNLPLRMDALRAEGAAFFGACTISAGNGEWQGIVEPVAILTAYTPKGRGACERWAAGISAKFGEECVACEHRAAPDFALVYARDAKAAA